MPRRSPAPPVPTFAELRQSSAWTWLYCNACGHSAPMAFVPLMIRWGPNASSDLIRERARCTQCSAKGATLSHPS